MAVLRLSALCLALASACKATDADCDAVGEHVVELSAKEAEAQGIPADFVKDVAEATKEEVVGDCKANKPSKREIDCLLEAASFAELKGCG